jgi:mitogen-activated protein kinase 1/3
MKSTRFQVALKRIPDVARDLENARKVLREVCIQRRVTHPHIVQLHDVFWTPSNTGVVVLDGGTGDR